MRILYDHQIFSYQNYGGVSRYFCELMKRIPSDLYFTSIKYSNNYYLKEVESIVYKPFFPNLDWYKKPRMMLELGKIHSLNVIKKNEFDVLHLTHYESYACDKTHQPIVTTYHDKLFSSFAYNARTIREQKKCFNRVDHVIAISKNTKKDLMDLFNYPEEKITVIYHGVNIPCESRKTIVDGTYILYVGARFGYKNFKLFLEAFANLENKDIKLFCAGPLFNNDEMEMINKLKLTGRIMQKRVTDIELEALYQNAILFCFPSLYEGFGMPLLEAMANGCPIACSCASSFPEIAGDAAIYFNAENRDSIVLKLESIISSVELQESLRSKGLERVKQFSWDKCVEKHMELYRSLV